MKTKATKCYKGRACIKENFSGDDVFFFQATVYSYDLSLA